jgi:nucleoid DNA-binding protein
MLITREMMIKKLSDVSGYYQKDIKTLLQALDEVVFECFNSVTDDEDISVQLVKGIKCGCKIVPERTRKDPRTQEDIVCKATVKPFARFSEDFRIAIQDKYDTKKDG